MTRGTASIDFGLLERLTDQFVCSRCFRAGDLRRISQVVSRHHRPKTLCSNCVPEVSTRSRAAVRPMSAARTAATPRPP